MYVCLSTETDCDPATREHKWRSSDGGSGASLPEMLVQSVTGISMRFHWRQREVKVFALHRTNLSENIQDFEDKGRLLKLCRRSKHARPRVLQQRKAWGLYSAKVFGMDGTNSRHRWLHPGKLTWSLKNDGSETNLLVRFQVLCQFSGVLTLYTINDCRLKWGINKTCNYVDRKVEVWTCRMLSLFVRHDWFPRPTFFRRWVSCSLSTKNCSSDASDRFACNTPSVKITWFWSSGGSGQTRHRGQALRARSPSTFISFGPYIVLSLCDLD